MLNKVEVEHKMGSNLILDTKIIGEGMGHNSSVYRERNDFVEEKLHTERIRS